MSNVSVNGNGDVSVTAETVTVSVNGDGAVNVTEQTIVNNTVGLPVFTDVNDLPTDGSVLVAILEPVGQIRGQAVSSHVNLDRALVQFYGGNLSVSTYIRASDVVSVPFPPGWGLVRVPDTPQLD